MTPKLIISSLVGIATIGGATGGYYYFKSKDPEKTQTSEEQSTPNTQNPDTQAKSSQPVQESVRETAVQAPVLNPEGAQESNNRGPSGSDAGRGASGSIAESGTRGETGPAVAPGVGLP